MGFNKDCEKALLIELDDQYLTAYYLSDDNISGWDLGWLVNLGGTQLSFRNSQIEI